MCVSFLSLLPHRKCVLPGVARSWLPQESRLPTLKNKINQTLKELTTRPRKNLEEELVTLPSYCIWEVLHWNFVVAHQISALVLYHAKRALCSQTAGLFVIPIGYSKVEWEAEPWVFRSLFCGISSEIGFGRQTPSLLLGLKLSFWTQHIIWAGSSLSHPAKGLGY